MKRNSEDIIDETCENCSHDRMWTSRGHVKPNYIKKCCRCKKVYK